LCLSPGGVCVCLPAGGGGVGVGRRGQEERDGGKNNSLINHFPVSVYASIPPRTYSLTQEKVKKKSKKTIWRAGVLVCVEATYWLVLRDAPLQLQSGFRGLGFGV